MGWWRGAAKLRISNLDSKKGKNQIEVLVFAYSVVCYLNGPFRGVQVQSGAAYVIK
jgi:hypothetical protein